MFAPCNIPLPRLVEQYKAHIARRKEHRKEGMQRGKLPPHVADEANRREAAILLVLQQRLEQEQNAEATQQ